MMCMNKAVIGSMTYALNIVIVSPWAMTNTTLFIA